MGKEKPAVAAKKEEETFVVPAKVKEKSDKKTIKSE